MTKQITSEYDHLTNQELLELFYYLWDKWADDMAVGKDLLGIWEEWRQVRRECDKRGVFV